MSKRRDDRSPEAQQYRRLYNTARWRTIRRRQLEREPLCRLCSAVGRDTFATVCDHVDPKAKETETGFFAGPFQSLCDAEPWRCHSSLKQKQEKRGYLPGCDLNGRPVDADHPWNRRRT